jgi:RimJ/RimL family protein N-acetyltransferase
LTRTDSFGLAAAVQRIETDRLLLRLVDAAEAQRICSREPSTADRWAPGYPFEGDLAALGGFLAATAQRGDQGAFGYYQILRRADDLAVGGIGFKGPPHEGKVEIGYGLIPHARGHGYAAEALVALLAVGRENGVTVACADTTHDNVASQRTLEHAGLRHVATDAELRYYDIEL